MHKLRSLPFFLVHIAALSVFFFPVTGSLILLCLASYYLRMFAITAGYHRYLSHRAYKTSRLGQFAIAFLGCTSIQKGPLWWAANHRLHHKHSDGPDDIHSPVRRGFWWSHVGWILSVEHDKTRWEQIPDLAKFPELRWLNRFHLMPVVLYGALIFAIGGAEAFAWGFLLSTVLLWHGTFSINSLAHVWGAKRYETGDGSRNNFWLALITLGEGWHNNHHRFMSSARQGFFWWELDGSYLVLRALRRLGGVWDLRQPPASLLHLQRENSSELETRAQPNHAETAPSAAFRFHTN